MPVSPRSRADVQRTRSGRLTLPPHLQTQTPPQPPAPVRAERPQLQYPPKHAPRDGLVRAMTSPNLGRASQPPHHDRQLHRDPLHHDRQLPLHDRPHHDAVRPMPVRQTPVDSRPAPQPERQVPQGARAPPPPMRPAPPSGPQDARAARESLVLGVMGPDAHLVRVDQLVAQTSGMGMREALQLCEDEKAAVRFKADGAVVGGKYRSNGQVLGEGSFAFVVGGKDVRTGQDVALKVLRKRFTAEARVERDVQAQLRGLRGAKIVRLLDYVEEGVPCIVFPLHGPNLARRLQHQSLTRPELQRLTAQLTAAVAAMHSVGVVHTDIRPENVVCDDPAGRGADFTVIDLGNASVHRRGERELDEINTRPYRAPEVLMRTGWSFPCDVWAVGCTLYEAATGERLFPQRASDSDHLAAVTRVVGQTGQRSQPSWPHAAVGCDPALSQLLQWSLVPDPAARVSAADAARHSFNS
eukprot:TRINITY_DN16285_c1_g1_i1.p2 TRINITY_DN16285_c1_g1~~TRINITY_DN16285_c1_g1_i1.p2  ORF type:complete len:486 (+),score=162.82 TRINITY_DN16285_c1_g1_i1:57-1460(+)